MDYKELATAVKLCGNEPNAALCEKCPYWSGLDMSKCIPRMTADAATAITDLLARAEAAEARAEKAERERDAAVALVHEWEQYGRYLSPMGFTVPPNWRED